MARLHHVARSRKEWTCSKCGKVIPVGQPYYHFQFYKMSRRVRCTNCRPKGSELIASAKRSALAAAEEDAMDALSALTEDDVEELKPILEQMGEQVREVGEEYRESAENIREHFQESSTADECEEWADQLDSRADDLEGWEPDEEDDFDSNTNSAIDVVQECPI